MTAINTTDGDRIPVYPFDPTGESPSNLVEEVHTLSQPNRGEFSYFIPRKAPFFNKSMVVVHSDTGDVLQYGKDYLFGGSYPEGILGVVDHQPLSGIVVILDPTVRGNYRIRYQTLGGEWALDEAEAIEVLRNRITNPFRVHWLDIINKPDHYPPAYHGHPAHGLDDYGDHINAFNRLIDALENMVSRDIEDRPDYTQLIVSIINQGRTVQAILAQLDEHDELLKKSVQGQLGQALKKIEAAEEKATELVNNLDQEINTKIDDRLAASDRALQALRESLNQLVNDLGTDLAGRVTTVENNVTQQGKDFTKQIQALDNKVTNDLGARITSLGSRLNTDLAGLRSELNQAIQNGDNNINNRITQLAKTIPDKLNPHFQSVTLDYGNSRGINRLHTPNISGLDGHNLWIAYDMTQDLNIAYHQPNTRGSGGTAAMSFVKKDYILAEIPLSIAPVFGSFRGWNTGIATRSNREVEGKEKLIGGLVVDNTTKEMLFPYNITADKTADDWYILKAKDFVTNDNTHRLSQKLNLSGGTITGDLTVNGNIHTDKLLVLSAINGKNQGIRVNRTGTSGNFPMWFEATPDKRWKFTVGTGNNSDVDFSIYLPAKGGTVALEGDMLPVGAMISFPNEVQNQPGFLLADGGTFDQNTYPDLYRVLGNRNRLPNNTSTSDIGMTAWFATDEIPEGWIAFDTIRTTVTEQSYPDLYRVLVKQYGNISRVPSVEDRFIRNAGSGLRVGTVQGDTMRNLTGELNFARRGNGVRDIYNGVFSRTGTWNIALGNGGSDDWGATVNMDASRQVPTSSEFRPKNIAMKLAIKAKGGTNGVRFWIKAYGNVSNAGTLNVESVVADVQRLRNEKADRSHRHAIADIDGLDDKLRHYISHEHNASTSSSGYGNRIIKFGDGTMIQVYRYKYTGSYRRTNYEKLSFNWPVAFRLLPTIWVQNVNKESDWGGVDIMVNIHSGETTNSKVTFHTWEVAGGSSIAEYDFIAIGKWK